MRTVSAVILHAFLTNVAKVLRKIRKHWVAILDNVEKIYRNLRDVEKYFEIENLRRFQRKSVEM